MAERKNLLILRLEGALQSWGENAKWDFRDSSSMPTKSGIVGLLGCAMGLERNSEVLAELAQNIAVASGLIVPVRSLWIFRLCREIL